MQILTRTIALLACLSLSVQGWAQSVPAIDAPRDATPATKAVLAEAERNLPPEDGQDFEFAQRGFIATWPEGVIKKANGTPSFDLTGNDFITAAAPDTVHPSLWRQNRVLGHEGLYKVTDGLYQVRNFDNSNVSFIETPSGWIVIDPLTVSEVAAAAWQLLRTHVADKPILAVIYTHTHTDHFAGIAGMVDPADVASGKVQIIAPKGFVEEVVSEWIIAGPAMGRRAFYQFGYFLPRGPKGHAGMGMGTAIAAGEQVFIPPTREIERTGESITIDGIEVVFQMTPGAEAPAEFNIWIPHIKALCSAETATSTLHNVQTLRGAKVRDAKAWADYLTETLRLWGDDVEVLFASHHWPRFGNDVIRTHLGNQRDAYKYIHDQTVRRMNKGETPTEIAEGLVLPPALQKDWSVRGYYGTVSHNSKAVYDRYMGWYDGVPANLNPYPPVERATKMVAAIGGRKALHKQAQAAFDAGDYRWAVELANIGVFSDPTDTVSRRILADSYEQLGYQSESAVWRNIYLSGAKELRQGRPDGYIETGPNYLMQATPMADFLDLLETTLVPERAGATTLAFNIVDSVSGDHFAITLRNSVIVSEKGVTIADAPTLTAPKPVLLGILFGQAPLDAMIAGGYVKLDGDGAPIRTLIPMLERPTIDFNIIEP